MARTKPTDKITVEFTYENDTKNKVRFDEPGTDPKIGKLYLVKEHYEALGKPEKVRVTVEAVS